MNFPFGKQIKSIRGRVTPSTSILRHKPMVDSDYIIKNLIISLDGLPNIIELGISIFIRQTIGREIFSWTAKFIS